MRNVLALLALLLAFGFSTPVRAALFWTAKTTVRQVRTYDGDTVNIWLSGISCQNQKNYFRVHDRNDNSTFTAIALTALTSGKPVMIQFDPDINGTHCYVRGIQIDQ